MDLKEIFHAYRAAEDACDIDGCAACYIAALDATNRQPELEQTPEVHYLEDGRLMVLVAAALFAMERGENQLADYFFQRIPTRILEKSSCFPECWRFLGEVAMRLGDDARATACFARHLQHFPDDEQAWFDVGNLRYHRGAWLPAVRAYQRARALRHGFRETAMNLAAAVQMMQRPESAERLPIAETADDFILVDAEEWDAVRQIPIFINCRDRVGCLSQLVTWLLDAGYQNLILLDNASTYPPLIAYYESLSSPSVRIIRLGENLGHKALWKSGLLEALSIDTPYVYTDPDVVPGEKCPPRFLQAFLRVLVQHPMISKVGAALFYKDITYEDRERKMAAEQHFYRVPAGRDAWYANIDTTFALYRDARYYHRAPAIRMAGPYTWRHLPWYQDAANLPEDEQYYLAHADQSSSLKAAMEQKKSESQESTEEQA